MTETQTTMPAERFRAVVERDRERGLLRAPGLRDWRYVQLSRSGRDQELIFEYHGPRDLLYWVTDKLVDMDDAPQEPRPRGYWKPPARVPDLEALEQQSADAHERLLESVGEYDHAVVHHRFQDVYNAQDFHYATSLASGVRTVLDYGAGYARQAFLFAQALPDARYVATDAVEQSYLLQNWVLDRLGLLRWEYLDADPDDGDSLARTLASEAGAYHVPTWRLDLLPAGSVDLVLFVWCLYELSPEAARTALAAVTRLVPVGGHVYIRDMPHTWSYRFDPERELHRHGFDLTFRTRKVGHDELHGEIRLYRRTAQRHRPRTVAAARRVAGRARRGLRKRLGRA
jgi:SAM-dependent methyltransferase